MRERIGRASAPRLPWLDRLRQDARHALRGLGRSPGFTITIVVTLALGIGANSVMFTVVDRLMFRPLAHLRDPERVHRIYWQWQERGVTRTALSTQYARYLDLARGATSGPPSSGWRPPDSTA